jgi:hypothetical protein
LFLRWEDPIPKVLHHGVIIAQFTLASNNCLKEVAFHPRLKRAGLSSALSV